MALIESHEIGHAHHPAIRSPAVKKERHEALGLAIGERLQHDAVHNRENGRIRTNTESQGEHGRSGEARALTQHAAGRAYILQNCFQQGKTSPVPVILLGLLDAAEFRQCLPPCDFRTHAHAQIVFDVHLEMALDLRGKIFFSPFLSKQFAQPQHPGAYQPHADSFPGARKRARISVVCSHSRASLSSCLRPARVSL